jgi:PleD family two-component response regulator
MTARERDDDLIQFASEEETGVRPEHSGPPWRILIVDDDEDVHRASRFALGDLHILGRPLEFLEARSARAAREILESERDIACILLDVVMETERAGLDLVEFVRRELGNSSIQIVLRTGQPGYAPELSVIRDYDINDYRSKSELTHTRLVTTLTAALRTYDQITTIEHSQHGLESLVRGAAELVNKHDLKDFCYSVLAQVEMLLDQAGDAMLCRRTLEVDKPWEVLAGSGEFKVLTGTRLSSFDQPRLVQSLDRVEHSDEEIVVTDGAILVPVRTASDELLVLRVLIASVPGPVQHKLLRLLAVNIAFGYENARMFEHVEHLAYFDELTGSPNRAAMLDLAGALIEKGDPFAVLVVDIDHFQTINDGLGREAGDRVLQEFLLHLGTAVGPGATVGRLGGDSFAAIVPQADIDRLESEYDQFCRGLARGLESTTTIFP